VSKIGFGGPGIASTESATVIGWSRARTSALPLTNDPASSDIVMLVNMAGPASRLGVEYYGDEVSLRQALIKQWSTGWMANAQRRSRRCYSPA